MDKTLTIQNPKQYKTMDDTLKRVNIFILIKMLTLFGVIIVLYFIKLLSGNRNFQ